MTSRNLLFFGISLAAIALFFVLREHWGHMLGLVPYLILLACPLMHLFHHHGGHHSGHDEHDTKKDLGSETSARVGDS
jgi:hypothetical protein